MTVAEIVKAYLVKNGYDGLCTEDCGCGVDNLFPCDGQGACDALGCEACVPAYRYTCDRCLLHDCEYRQNGDKGCFRITKKEEHDHP